MKPFKVALLCIDVQGGVPRWVEDEITDAGIEFVYHHATTREDVARYAADADVVWVFGGGFCLHGNMDLLQRCGAIIRTGSGTDDVPVAEATELGIVVANTPEGLSDFVAEHTIGLLLAITRQIPIQDRCVRAGKWDRANAWPRWHLQRQTLGVVGFGHIARAVVNKLRGFEMRVLVSDPFVDESVIKDFGAEKAEFDGLLREAHFVTVHAPLTETTHHLFGSREFGLMRQDAILINTSRGPLVDEKALLEALTTGQIAAAGLDVTEEEPPDPNNPLFQLPNVVVTPHIAAYSDIFEERQWRVSVDTVKDLAAGRWPRSCVNRSVQPRWEMREA